MSHSILGLDFGSSALKLAVFDGKKIVRLAVEPMPDRFVRAGGPVSPEAMASFLKQTLKKHRIRTKKAAVVIPSGRAFVLRTAIPPMTVPQLRLNLPYEFRDFITEERDKYFYDYAVIATDKKPNGETEKLQIFAAAVEKSAIAAYRDLCRWAGLKLVAAIPTEFAWSGLLRSLEKQTPGSLKAEHCIVDLGHEESRAFFYDGDDFRAAHILDRGGVSIDRLLSDELGVDVHIARTHKETNQQGELLREDVRAFFDDLFHELQRAVNFFNYNNPDADLSDIWLAGGLGRVDALLSSAKEVLGSELRLHGIGEMVSSNQKATLISRCALALGTAMSISPEKDGNGRNAVPRKRSLNLLMRDKKPTNWKVVLPVTLVTAALIAAFCKFGVLDRIAAASAAEQKAAAAEQRVAELLEKLEPYDEIELEHERYISTAFRPENMPRNVLQIFELLESRLMSHVGISSVRFSGNTLHLEIVGTTLKEASSLLVGLYEDPSVADVRITTANSEDRPEDTRSTIIMTITVKEPPAESDASSHS